jgi:dihydropteroate synthase
MDEGSAATAVEGLHAVTLLVDQVDDDSKNLLSQSALLRGLELVTGDGWLALSGSTSSLAGLARAGPEVLPHTLAREVGVCLSRVTEKHQYWRTARGDITIDRPLVVGILNATPDSFSDGGKYLDCDSAVAHAESLIGSGADMIDLGGESTRPGRPDAVPAEEEWRRLRPVLERLARDFPALPLSVDTVKSEVADRSLDSGAWAVNDVSTLRLDPRIANVCAERGAGMILSHSRGSFSEMAGYEHAKYADVTSDTADELMAAVELAEGRGVMREQMVIDPGLGFAKTPEQNCEVLRGLPLLVSLGIPIMVGPSRKRFLGAITGRETLERDTATAAACVAAFIGGAYLFRVHDVARVKEALAVAEAVRSM